MSTSSAARRSVLYTVTTRAITAAELGAPGQEHLMRHRIERAQASQPLERNSALQCDVEEAVQQQVRPCPEPVLDSGLELARTRDALHDVRDVVQAEQRAPLDGDAGIGDVTRPTQVLPVPDEVVVDEQLGGGFRP